MSQKNLFVPCDEELHQSVKQHCVEHKISISDFIINLIKQEIHLKGPVHGKKVHSGNSRK